MRMGTMSAKAKAASWSPLLVLMGFVAACAATRSHLAATQGLEAAEGASGSKWNALRMVTSRWGLGTALAREELESCQITYGIFPCSTTIIGNIFLLGLYVYMLLKAAQYLSTGCELLLTVTSPGIIGGLVLPILSSLPDALLILASGLSGSKETAQSQVHVGMGLLAGGNIVLLTILWGGALIVGRCDLEHRGGQLVAKHKTLKNGCSLTGTGVTTDQQTRVSCWIMIVTLLPYLVAQTPVVLGISDTMGPLFVSLGCALSLIGLVSYCTYQVAFPWIQQRSIYRAKQKVQRSRALHHISQFSSNKSWGGLLLDDGVTLNEELLCELFKYFDVNKDGVLTLSELRGLIIGLGIQKKKDPNEEEFVTWMKDFDSSKDGLISLDEFLRGMEKWVRSFVGKKRPRETAAGLPSGGSNKRDPSEGEYAGDEAKPHLFWHHNQQAESSLNSMLEDQGGDEEDENGVEAPPTKGQVILHSVRYLTLGAVGAGVVAGPLVNAIGDFSTVTGISLFFISFVGTPLASCSSDAMSSLLFAAKKTKKNISMSYSQIYGGVTMSNTMCLAIFLAIVYTRGLTWDFSSEVLVILVATVVIGSVASVRVTFPLWTAFVALLLYPLSIVLVAVLDYGFGWV